MINSVLRTFSSLLILASLGVTVFALYFMANDLSSMGIYLSIDDLEVSDDNLYFDFILNFSYSGVYPVHDFQVKMNLDGLEFSSQSITLKKGLNVIKVTSTLNVNFIGKNVTAMMTITGSYARILPFSVTVSPKDYFKIDIFPRPIEVSVSDFNSTHALVLGRLISIAKINLNVIVTLMADDIEISRVTVSPPIESGKMMMVKWYVKYEDLERLSRVDLYLSTAKGLIKIYSWRLHG